MAFSTFRTHNMRDSMSLRVPAPPLIAVPALGWLVWFLLIPMGIVAVYSFLTKGVYGGIVFHATLENFVRTSDHLYFWIYLDSVKLALATTLMCLLAGYPMAYAMATSSRRWRPILLVLVTVPFWTNFVIRAYAIKVLMSAGGPVNQLLMILGIVHDPIPLTDNDFCVWVGMFTNYLPFMVLPLYVSLEKFDFTLLEAARDLGASSFSLIKDILLPLTKSGVITGTLLVFIPALGEFVIPDMLGGARTMLIGNLITEQFLKARDWPFGAALSMLLIMSVAVGFVICERQEKATA